MAYGKDNIAQASSDALKVARSAIRLRHSIAADNELNEVMPLIGAQLVAMQQRGQVPSLTMGDIENMVASVQAKGIGNGLDD